MKTVESMDVHFLFPGGTCAAINMTVQEAFNVLMMPSFAGLITHMSPVYGLSSVSEPENKE